MPTTDRTTIRATLDELVNKFRTNLVASPPTSARPFHAVHVGTPGATDHPRPFLAVDLSRVNSISASDGDRILEVEVALRAVVDVDAKDPFGAVLDSLGAIDDYLDSLIGPGVLDGSEGFDYGAWSIDSVKAQAGSRAMSATGMLTFAVKVERNQNRVPAV